MPKTEQKTTRRFSGGRWITETEGKDYDAKGAAAAEESGKKAFAAMTSGAKPKVSTDEPKDRNSVSWMAWKRKQKGRTAHDAAVALASR
jgi:hypothetical protein